MPIKKKRNKSPKTLAKEEAWKWFSRLRRTQECYRDTGTLTEGFCVTTGVRLPIKKLQAGHCVSGRTEAVLFVREAVHNQSYRANMALHGMYDNYSIYIIDRYGLDKWRELVSLKEKKVSHSAKYYQQKAKEYEKEYHEFCKHPYIVK